MTSAVGAIERNIGDEASGMDVDGWMVVRGKVMARVYGVAECGRSRPIPA
ncbi:MAG: hypothetical protein ACK4IT_05805 [Thioalkalivibrionaceae bacterium]